MKTAKSTAEKKSVHFVCPDITNPTNPITINLIGTGGTGSALITALIKINAGLLALGHPGLSVFAYDPDRVEPANLGRQLFDPSELGQYKAVALINRANRFWGTNWKAIPEIFTTENAREYHNSACAKITLSCVDTIAARFSIAQTLSKEYQSFRSNKNMYWMDFGNDRYTGQVVLATVRPIKQPKSKKYLPAPALPLVTEEFKEQMQMVKDEDNTPSCSLAQALSKQDMFINPVLANLGASLLMQLLTQDVLEIRGFFHNLQTFRTTPIPIAIQ